MKPAGDGRFAWPLVFGIAYLVLLALCGWTLVDGPLVDDNPLLFSAQADSIEKWRLLLAPHADTYWRPVAKLTLLPAAWTGYATWPHRLMALLLHALATMLLWQLARRFYDRQSANWAAAVFLLHPIHAGTIYWISARYDLVAACFVMGAVLAALPDAAGEFKSRRRWLAALLTLLASLSKEIAFITPLLIAAAVWLQSDRPPREKIMLVRRQAGGSLIALVLVIAVRLALMHRIGGPETLAHPEPGLILGNLLFSIPLALLAPINWQAVGPRAVWPIGLAWLTLSLTLIFLFAGRRREPRLWLGWAWIPIAALPLAGFIFLGGSLSAGYMLYLPSAGLALWWGALLSWPSEQPPKHHRLARAVLQTALLIYCAAGLLLNLNAYHRAERVLAQITSLVRSFTMQNPAQTILLEDPPNEIAGLPLFYDHLDQFFLPFPDLAERRILMVGPNFYRTAGSALSWSDPAWMEQTAVLRWQGNRQGLTTISPLEVTEPTRQGWQRRRNNPTASLAMSVGQSIPANVSRTGKELAWRRGPLTLPLLAEGTDNIAARVFVGQTSEIKLTFAVTPNDPRAAAEARFDWIDQNEANHSVLFAVIADGQPHTYTLPLAADSRWARTLYTHGLALHLPFRAGRLRF